MSFISGFFKSFKNIHVQSLIGNAVMAVFGMVTLAILYRAFSVNDIGIYVFFMTVIGLLDTLKGGFLNNAFIKFYSGVDTIRAKEVAGSVWTLSLIVTGLVIIINIPFLFFISHFQNVGVKLFIQYFSIIFLSSLPFFMATLVVQGEKRFDRLLWLRLFNQAFFIIAILLLIAFKNATLTSVIIAYVICNLLSSLAALLLGWTKISTIKYTTKKTLSEIFHFGKYSAGIILSTNLFKVTDSFFLTFFLGPAALAMYNLGGRLNQVVEIPIQSFAASGIHVLAGYYNTDQKQKMMLTMQKFVGSLSVVVFFLAGIAVIFAEPIIGLVGGSKYIHTAAPNLFRIFIIISILYPADRFFALALDVIHKPKINFYKILVMLAVNLIADFIGVKIFKSVYSIVLTNIFPVLVAILISYYHLNKYYKFSFWNIFVQGFKETKIYLSKIHLPFGPKQLQN